MDNEYDHMEELGLMQDRQFVCGCRGFLTPNDSTRDLCARFMRDGGRVFDILSMYEWISAIIMDNDKEDANGRVRTAVPLLRANGVTDHGAYMFFKDNLRLMPGAARAMHYLCDLEPCFINTGALDHHMMNVTEVLGIPMTNVNCSQVSFDSIDIGRDEGKEIRDIVARIAKMEPKDMPNAADADARRNRKGWKMVSELDSIFTERIPKMDFYDDVSHVISIGASEKSYTLLEIRNQSNIDFNSTVYVGSSQSDRLAMDIIRDTGGLAVSFNGCAEAVANSDIAIMSPDSTVVAVIGAEFYNEGIEAVYDLVERWDIEYIREKEGPDRHLIDELLRVSKKGLPEVVRVQKDNLVETAEKSERYRKKQSVSKIGGEFQEMNDPFVP